MRFRCEDEAVGHRAHAHVGIRVVPGHAADVLAVEVDPLSVGVPGDDVMAPVAAAEPAEVGNAADDPVQGDVAPGERQVLSVPAEPERRVSVLRSARMRLDGRVGGQREEGMVEVLAVDAESGVRRAERAFRPEGDRAAAPVDMPLRGVSERALRRLRQLDRLALASGNELEPGGRQGLDLARRRDGGGAVLERRGEEQAGRDVIVRSIRHEDVRMPVPVPVEPDQALAGCGEVEVHEQFLESVRDAGAALVVVSLGGKRVGAARAEPERAVGARARRTRLEHRGLAEHARPFADESEVASAVFLDREGAAREAHLVRPRGKGAAEIEVDRAVGIVRARDERLVKPFPAGVRNDVDEGVLGCGRRREHAQRDGENSE